MIIIRDGKKYTLTPEEMEQAFREHKHNYLLADAESQFQDFVRYYHSGDENLFAKVFGFTVEDVCDPDSSYYLLEKFVAAYEKAHDCSNAENDMWQEVVRNVLLENAVNFVENYTAEFILWEVSDPASWRKIASLYRAYPSLDNLWEIALSRTEASLVAHGVRNGKICVSTTIKKVKIIGADTTEPWQERDCVCAARKYSATITDGKLVFVDPKEV